MTGPPSGGLSREAGGGSIYDLGYRGYEGPRLGRRAAVAALLTHSIRTAFGLGRGARSKVMPVGLTVLAILPSLLALGILALISQFGEAGEALEAISPVRYETLFPFIATLVFLFCASQAPELFGRDQRSGILPLYFSRAVSRLDYASARLLGMLSALLILVWAPYLLLMVGRILVAANLSDGLADELPSLPLAISVGLVVAGLVGTISAAIASLTPRRAYATVAIIAVFLVPNIGASMLVEMDAGLVGQIAVLLSPADVLDGVNAVVFDARPDNPAVRQADLPEWAYIGAAVAWISVSVLVLLNRYRHIDA
jgi:ABC-2 type transport system permease protein